MTKGLPKAGKTTARFKAIDWLRGLSVLFMIECHTLYFLSPSLERTPDWYQLQNINGLVSVSFLFAAGFSLGLVGARAAGDVQTRARRSKRTLLRIAEVMGLALFINQASHDVIANPIWLLRPDILSCIVAGLLVVWAIVTTCRGRNGLALSLLAGSWLSVMIATFWASGYRGGGNFLGLINNSSGAMFPLFPWIGYLLLGGVMGVAAAHPTTGRARLIYGLVAMTAVTLVLAMTPAERWPWRPFAAMKLDTYLVSNACERLWKLGAICLTLAALEKVTTLVGAVAWALRPASTVLEYFSGKSLSAYFVHLTLLYGFLGVQFTQMWHRNSSWGEYRWRLGAMYGLTALVCYGLHRARRSVEAIIRNRSTARVVVGAEAA
ncbi:MAG: hypothetical protein JWN40_695 [Phycisphaerales bacterium]|nr:hypothetical protein [Phycisphaerales bacterium]